MQVVGCTTFSLTFPTSLGTEATEHSQLVIRMWMRFDNISSGKKEHHKRISFRQEFIQFLDANNIEYDPRYV